MLAHCKQIVNRKTAKNPDKYEVSICRINFLFFYKTIFLPIEVGKISDFSKNYRHGTKLKLTKSFLG